MSVRSEILGWVIRRLHDIDPGNPVERHALFETLRDEIGQHGFGSLTPDEALPHLESAIARQEVYWLGQAVAAPHMDAPPIRPVPDDVAPASSPKWGWRRFMPVPKTPPGPPPGEATGPYADHVYETVPLIVSGQAAECRLSWTYDPACILTAHCSPIDFTFETRAFSFRHAVEHLGGTLRRRGLLLPVAAFAPSTVWLSEARNEEALLPVGGGATVHAFSPSGRN